DLRQGAVAAGGGDFSCSHRHVARTEVHGVGLELLDPCASADRLVVDCYLRILQVVVVESLLVQRVREAGARAGDAARTDVDSWWRCGTTTCGCIHGGCRTQQQEPPD